jgi:Flp pilus assembly pilin Flp
MSFGPVMASLARRLNPARLVNSRLVHKQLINSSLAQRLGRRFWRDKSGVAAIEFAFIAPLMFFMFVGTVEMSQAITVDRRVTLVASTVADLVAREQQVAKKDLDVIMQVINVLLAPYASAPLEVTLMVVGSKVGALPGDPNRVCWSFEHQHANPSSVGSHAINADYVLPAGIIEPGGSVVVAEVAYKYTPLLFNYFITAAFPLRDRFFLKPRVSSFIPFDKNDSGTYQNRDDDPKSCHWN